MPDTQPVVSRQRLYQLRYPERHRAQQAVNYAVRTGKLIKPARCSRCEAIGPVSAHHAMGYAQKYWFALDWLCGQCHRERHNKERENMRNLQDIETTKVRADGRKVCTTWIKEDLWVALRVACAKTNQRSYVVIEEALRKHPLVKKELNNG
jgi:hypothetical protein